MTSVWKDTFAPYLYFPVALQHIGIYHLSLIPGIQVPHTHLGKMHSKSIMTSKHNQIQAHFDNSKKRICLSHCFDVEKHIFQRASLFMPPNYKHHYWAQTRQFNSQLNGLQTELLIDAEFTWEEHSSHS